MVASEKEDGGGGERGDNLGNSNNNNSEMAIKAHSSLKDETTKLFELADWCENNFMVYYKIFGY